MNEHKSPPPPDEEHQAPKFTRRKLMPAVAPRHISRDKIMSHAEMIDAARHQLERAKRERTSTMNIQTQNDGGTAYPCHGPSGQVFQYGMTLRDYFAGQALAGILANFNSGKQAQSICGEASASKAAFEMADVMIAAREQKEGV